MKRKRYSVEQIVAAVKQHELGTPAADIARKLGIAEQTFYRWKKQYGGLEASEVRELKQLREENAKLKKLVADLSLDKLMLQDIASKAHCRSTHRFSDSGGIVVVVLVGLDVRLHKLCWHELDLMPVFLKLSGKVLSSRTGFHTDQAWRVLCDKLSELLTREFVLDQGLAGPVSADHMKNVLADIDAYPLIYALPTNSEIWDQRGRGTE